MQQNLNPPTLPGVGSVLPRGPGCWQQQWLPWVVLVGQGLPLWVGCCVGGVQLLQLVFLGVQKQRGGEQC